MRYAPASAPYAPECADPTRNRRHFRRPLALYGRRVYTGCVAGVKERWDFRVEPDTDRLVRQAAASSQRTLTDFVVDAAVLEAERLLADRTTFELERQQ